MKTNTTTPLLSYNIKTEPNPVNISSGNKPATAKITITIGANSKIRCKDITVQIPIGSSATDMYQVSPTPTGSIQWKPWELAANPHSNPANTKTFFFKNTDEDKAVKSDIRIILEGTVNLISGIAVIQLIENSTSVTDNKYMKRQKPIDIKKSGEEAFFLNNVVASSLTATGHPVAEFEKNKGLQLTWQSNGDAFKVYSRTNLRPGTQTAKFHKIDKGLVSDTTFIIEATKAGKTLYQEYLVKVKESNESFNELDVKGVMNLSTKAIDKLTGDVLTTKTIKDLSGKILSTEAIENILSKPISLLGKDYISINPYHFRAETDGFLIMKMTVKPNNWSIGVLEIECDKMTFPHTVFSHPDMEGQSTLTVPLQKGGSFGVTGTAYGSISIYKKYYWISIGQGRTKTSSTRRTKDEPAILIKMKKNKNAIKVHQQKAEDLVSALEEAFEKTLSSKVRKKLIDKIL